MRMQNAALAYAEKLVWPVLPLRGKIPLTEHGVREATYNPSVIRAWWQRWPDANVGVACFRFTAVDIDDQKALPELGKIPDTPIQHTGGGGMHILFKHEPGMRNRVGALPGIDVRSGGGYIVAAPSIHPTTGTIYEWDKVMHPMKMPLAEMPAHIKERLTPPEIARTPVAPPANEAPYIRAAVDAACRAISMAVPGIQEQVLHCESYAIGRLTGNNAYAEQLISAGSRMRNQPGREPWAISEIERKVVRALELGARNPRIKRDEIER